ncbi:hypothetical protein [Mechercharimyces sp. CAU 1602]|uniref:hypothetical protein n=1 Tax=Mechercharimyces sp. CAU 1602 TaxID=2973933 RepID=UPI0021627A87|nr:hypothetical protein [Mechercharimyces sp. CAU 1602]MCS1350001.1 hypothetical protein [Mechercharimyces sp. CAU 1602]
MARPSGIGSAGHFFVGGFFVQHNFKYQYFLIETKEILAYNSHTLLTIVGDFMFDRLRKITGSRAINPIFFKAIQILFATIFLVSYAWNYHVSEISLSIVGIFLICAIVLKVIGFIIDEKSRLKQIRMTKLGTLIILIENTLGIIAILLIISTFFI